MQKNLEEVTEMMMEAQARGLIVERITETTVNDRTLTQQHLVMPTDTGVPEIKLQLWEKVSASRTAQSETK